MAAFQVGDKVICVDDGSATGSKKAGIINGQEYTISDVRSSDGMVELDHRTGYFYPRRFKLAHAYDVADGAVWVQADNSVAIDMTVSGASTTGGNLVVPAGLTKHFQGSPDPGKPFPDPVAEKEKSAEDKLREYRRSLRDMLGQG